MKFRPNTIQENYLQKKKKKIPRRNQDEIGGV